MILIIFQKILHQFIYISKLEKLIIDCNKITDGIAIDLTVMLESNSTLIQLHINFNAFTN